MHCNNYSERSLYAIQRLWELPVVNVNVRCQM